MKRYIGKLVFLASLVAVLVGCRRQEPHGETAIETQKIRFAVSPYQDSLLPILGGDDYTGLYKKAGLKVDFIVLTLAEAREALAAGKVDLIWNNIGAVASVHEKAPNIVFWYPVNTFDNGFALMIRTNGGFKSLADFEGELHNHTNALIATARQLKGKRVVTTGNSDFEQSIANIAKRAGLIYSKDSTSDITIIDLPPDDGLAAFLSGTGDAYLGGIPQRVRANKEGMKELLSGPEIGLTVLNGFVTTKEFDQKHRDSLLALLNVWFKIVNEVETNRIPQAKAICNVLNKYTGASFDTKDFNQFWQNYEHFPLTPAEVEKDIILPSGPNYWGNQWNEANHFFHEIAKSIPKPVPATGSVLIEEVQKAYLQKYPR